METKKDEPAVAGRKSRKGCVVALIIIAFIFIILSVILVSASRFLLSPGALMSLKDKFPGFESFLNLKSGGSEKKGASFSAQSANAEAKLFVPEKALETKPELIATSEADWPKNALGVFSLDAGSEKPKQAITFSMTLKELPKGYFSLGFWDPEKKEWEKLPTVRREGLTYETVLTHASFPGGYTVENNFDDFVGNNPSEGATHIEFQDRENQQLFQELLAELSKIQIDQQTGEAAGQNDAGWERVREILDELASKVINDYCGDKSPQSASELYMAWEITNRLGFSSIDNRFVRAIETDCDKKKKTTEYAISQVDVYDYQGRWELPSDVVDMHLDAKSIQRSISNGFQVGVGNDQSDWKCEWQMDQVIVSDISGDGRSFLEDTQPDYYTMIDVPFRNIKGYSGDSWTFRFSLEGVSAGETFPVVAERTSDFNISAFLPTQTARYIHQEEDVYINETTTYSFEDSSSMPAGIQRKYTGTLLEDNGKNGALIVFSTQEYNDDQKRQMETGKEAADELFGGIGKMGFDAKTTELLEKFYSGQGETGMKPLRIVPQDDIDDDANDPGIEPANMGAPKKAPQKDPLPDLVPLPGSD